MVWILRVNKFDADEVSGIDLSFVDAYELAEFIRKVLENTIDDKFRFYVKRGGSEE